MNIIKNNKNIRHPTSHLNNPYSFIVDLSIRRGQEREEKDRGDEHVDTIPSWEVYNIHGSV